MFRSAAAMAAERRDDLQPDKEEWITPSDDERKKFRARRIELGLRQKDVAGKVGLTAASISNVETGRSHQIEKVFYARLRHVLRIVDAAPAESSVQAFRSLVDAAVDLDERETKIATALIETIKKTRNSK